MICHMICHMTYFLLFLGPVDPEEKRKKNADSRPQVNKQTAITLTQDEWRVRNILQNIFLVSHVV